MFRHTRRTSLLATTAAAALVLAGCAGGAGQGAPASNSTSDTTGFPLTVAHMYGETVLDAPPQRVATWGWGATDAVLALGLMPVAIPSIDYGGGDDRLTPWVVDAIEQVGGEQPAILDNASYELSVEELLAAAPDVLIAPYSGLTQDEYDAVTEAGIPVIAPEEELWATPWRDVISVTGEVLGLQDEADRVLADIDGLLAEAAADNPDFEGTTLAYAADDVDTFYLYLPADPRQELLEDLGFVTADAVTALDTGESTFYTTVSSENLDQVDADVIFTQVESEEALETFLTSERTRLIPAVARGAVGAIVGEENVTAISPTALSVAFILPQIVEQLAQATTVARG